MNSNILMQRIVGALGIAAIATSTTLPALAQTRPNPVSPSAPGAAPEMQMDRMPATPNTRPNTRPGTERSPGASEQQSPVRPNPSGQRPTNQQANALDREFILMAARSNNAEIRTSQLALQRSSNSQVRQYAQRMITEHTAANRQLEPLARQYNLALPSDVDPLSQAIEQQLTQLSGSEFDRAYMQVQASAHLRAVGLFQTQVDQGRDAAVRQFAVQLLPSIQDHYQMASRMIPSRNALEINPSQPMQNQRVQ